MGMQCYTKKEDNSLIDVESAETTGDRCRHLSWRTPLNSSLCTFIRMKHISPTFMYIIPMFLRLTTFTKTLPQMSFHLYFCYFYFALGLHPWLCWLLDRSQILGCPRQLQTYARLMQGWVASAGCPPPPPQTKTLATPVTSRTFFLQLAHDSHILRSQVGRNLVVSPAWLGLYKFVNMTTTLLRLILP